MTNTYTDAALYAYAELLGVKLEIGTDIQGQYYRVTIPGQVGRIRDRDKVHYLIEGMSTLRRMNEREKLNRGYLAN